MRRAISTALGAALAACVLVGVAGCTGQAGADPGAQPRHYPAAAAGGACLLLDYNAITAAVGVTFDTAGASRRDDTYSCVVTQGDADYPDLALSVTPTKADEVIFAASVSPSGSTPVKGLGKIAYVVDSAAGGGHGPRWEVGWLSGNQRLMVLRFTFAKGAPAADVSALKAKIVELAKRIDRTDV
jgi:hypothetical protein